MNFTHFHVHTEYSPLDGLGKVDEYVKRAKELDQKVLAITDHGNIDGHVRFHKACKKEGIRPIFGCEAYLVKNHLIKKKEKRHHITLLVKNEYGYKNLCEILSIANLDGYYRKPRIDFDILQKHSKGLIILSGCIASFLQDDNLYEEYLPQLINTFKDDLFLEVMPLELQIQKDLNLKIKQIQKRFNLSLIGTNDCHYVLKEDVKVHEILLCIQRSDTWANPNRWKFDERTHWLKSGKEMFLSFLRQGIFSKSEIFQMFKNNSIIENKVNFELKEKNISLPKVEISTINFTGEKAFNILIAKGMREKQAEFINNIQVYKDRIKEEKRIILSKGLCDYFLITYDLLQFCKEKNILTSPGRGSVGGSLVAYILGITQINPIKHDLLFSRFIAEDRNDYPDIDIDFESLRIGDIFEYLSNKYGKDKVAVVASFQKMQDRAAFKDICRVFSLCSPKQSDFISTQIEELDDIKKIAKDFYNEYKEYLDYAYKIRGRIRSYTKHAAGVIISKNPLSGQGVISESEGVTKLNWDKDDCEYLGLLKLDILALNTLDTIKHCLNLIEEKSGNKIDLTTLDLKDKNIFRIIAKGDTSGIFQFNTWPMTKLSKDLQVNNFKEMCATTALVRPGPMNSGMTKEYIKRKFSKKWKKLHPIYEEITKDTYGCIAYQEQVMQCINRLAGLPYTTADRIRKIIAKKSDVGAFEKYKELFILGCKNEKTLSKKEAIELWKGFEEHAAYSFNLSHSVGYSVLSYWCAWLKVYFPHEFILASLKFAGKKGKQTIIDSSIKGGLEFKPPTLKDGLPYDWKIENDYIIPPFIEIKGIGPAMAEKISTPIKTKGFFKLEVLSIPEKVEKIFKDMEDGNTAYFDFNVFGSDRW